MNEDIVEYAKSRGFGDLHLKIDQATGLIAIIAIHNTKLGPALGGCRCIEYESTNSAVYDAMRLARAMSYKAALLDLPHGGGKSVLVKPKSITDRKAYFEAFGRFVDEIGGRYITAVDSGTTVADMDTIATQTPYVTSVSTMNGETSHFTALGVKRGIEASLKFKFGSESLPDRHVAIQGVGNVGYFLAKELHQAGAQLTVTDIDEQATARCVEEFQAKTVDAEAIYAVDCDVFSPCALGAIINETTVEQIKAPIIAGSANNQLVNLDFAEVLHQRGFLYVPDYVINAGGLIYAAGKYDGEDDTVINDKLTSITRSLMTIFERSQTANVATLEVAEKLAEEKLY